MYKQIEYVVILSFSLSLSFCHSFFHRGWPINTDLSIECFSSLSRRITRLMWTDVQTVSSKRKPFRIIHQSTNSYFLVQSAYSFESFSRLRGAFLDQLRPCLTYWIYIRSAMETTPRVVKSNTLPSNSSGLVDGVSEGASDLSDNVRDLHR